MGEEKEIKDYTKKYVNPNYMKDYYVNNRDRILQQKKLYYQNNKDKLQTKYREKYWRDKTIKEL